MPPEAVAPLSPSFGGGLYRPVCVLALVLAVVVAVVGRPGAIRSGPVAESTATTVASAAGSYTGPAAKGVVGSREFDNATGTTSAHILDFEADDSWTAIEGPSWLLSAHAGQAKQLELSIPLWPTIGGSLSACAAGSYDSNYVSLARHLVAAGLDDTIVRPGWELNGNWMRWSALAEPGQYARCFQNLVHAMRSVSGGSFRYDWCVAVNLNVDAALAAWPGADVVDFVGVDVYDIATSYTRALAETELDQARRQAVAYRFGGPGGVKYWARFARDRGVKVAIPEWGLTTRSDGGGGDNTYFVDAMFDAVEGLAGIAQSISYAQYFNVVGATGDHRLIGTNTFPASAATFRNRLLALPRQQVTPVTSTPGKRQPAASVVPLRRLKMLRSPKVVGRFAVGHTLRVATGKWAVRPQVRYQWFAEGRPIARATKATLRLRPGYVSRRISVRITVHRAGYANRLVVLTRGKMRR